MEQNDKSTFTTKNTKVSVSELSHLQLTLIFQLTSFIMRRLEDEGHVDKGVMEVLAWRMKEFAEGIDEVL